MPEPETLPREWPWRARLNETPPREWRSRARFSETTSWTPSQPIWPAAGQRRTAGPSSVRRDRRSRRNSWSVGVGSDQPLRPLARKLAESGRLSPSSRKLLDNEVTLPRARSGTYSMKARGVQSSSVQTETFTIATQSRGERSPTSPPAKSSRAGFGKLLSQPNSGSSSPLDMTSRQYFSALYTLRRGRCSTNNGNGT
jgi:hypothetical protein